MNNVGNHHGYFGAFTTDEVEGAFSNGARVVKVAEDKPGEGTPLGTGGKILGSMFEPRISRHVMYFVEWDDKPRIAVGCIAWKLKLQ